MDGKTVRMRQTALPGKETCSEKGMNPTKARSTIIASAAQNPSSNMGKGQATHRARPGTMLYEGLEAEPNPGKATRGGKAPRRRFWQMAVAPMLLWAALTII